MASSSGPTQGATYTSIPIEKGEGGDLEQQTSAQVRRWLKPPRRLKFTQIGKYFTGMTLLIGFGAINTGNNLLYLLLGMMLTLIVISGILSEAVIKELRVARRFPNRIFANNPTPVEVVVENLKPRVPSFSIQVVDRLVGLDKESRPAVYLMRLDPKDTTRTAYRYAFPRRGRWQVEGYEIATRFPFDLFRKSRDIDEPTSVVVYPTPIEPPGLMSLANLPDGDVNKSKPGRGIDFYGIRDYRAGDDARDVHWKLTARRGQLVVREYEQEQNRAVTLCFVNVWEPPASMAGTDEGLARYRDELEFAVASCAGAAQALLARGFAVGLNTLDGRVGQGTGPGQLDRILHTLALVTFRGDPEVEADAARVSKNFEVDVVERCIIVGHSDAIVGVQAGEVIATVPCKGVIPKPAAERANS
ncbi:MAG: DUF58 domain-containing protein [Myxococcales bacterium]|nr:DUF58 domain-containing protein [Myxococcales bacterium]